MIELVPLSACHVARVRFLEAHPLIRSSLVREPASLAEIAARVDSTDADAVFFSVEERWTPADPLWPRSVGYLELRAVRVGPVEAGSFEVFLAPRVWGRGYGRELVRRAAALALERWGLDAMLIGVFADNVRALALYESLGYAEIDRQWHYPAGGGSRRRWFMMSNRPELFRRRVGFR